MDVFYWVVNVTDLLIWHHVGKQSLHYVRMVKYYIFHPCYLRICRIVMRSHDLFVLVVEAETTAQGILLLICVAVSWVSNLFSVVDFHFPRVLGSLLLWLFFSPLNTGMIFLFTPNKVEAAKVQQPVCRETRNRLRSPVRFHGSRRMFLCVMEGAAKLDDMAITKVTVDGKKNRVPGCSKKATLRTWQ